MSDVREWIGRGLEQRLEISENEWYSRACDEIGGGVEDARFGALLSMASRHCRRGRLAPSEEEREAANKIVRGWEPERWRTLEAARVGMILSRPDLAQESCVGALEACFVHADEGELCALYRSLAFLPGGARFAWRAGEGCRTNMLTVFEANACDTPYPAANLDEIAWRQLVVKALFVGAPVWRIRGLDKRLDGELARMTLDLVDERWSAGREIHPELWLCLGEHAGERGRRAIEAELSRGSSIPLGRAGACLGLARSGRTDLLRAHGERETDALVSDTIDLALEGRCDQWVWRGLAEQAVANGINP